MLHAFRAPSGHVGDAVIRDDLAVLAVIGG
jgi:hypothetical protein